MYVYNGITTGLQFMRHALLIFIVCIFGEIRINQGVSKEC